MERRTYPRLWHEPDDERVSSKEDKTANFSKDESLSGMMDRFTLTQARPRSLLFLLSNSMVVGQEFVLAFLLIEWHRIELNLEDESHQAQRIAYIEWKQMVSLVLVLFALLTIVCFGHFGGGSERIPKQRKRDKLRIRVTDALLLAGILRLLSAVLRTLTASYSSDTVYALAISGMAIHLGTCDFAYANGRIGHPTTAPSNRRPVFQGGTLSLNAALFSTTLLASRLSSNSSVYIFISSSITLFAFYPETRHTISTQPHAFYASFLITALLSLALLVLLVSAVERAAFVGLLAFVCFVAPVWKYWLQSSKRIIAGPWDIAHVSIQSKRRSSKTNPQIETTNIEKKIR